MRLRRAVCRHPGDRNLQQFPGHSDTSTQPVAGKDKHLEFNSPPLMIGQLPNSKWTTCRLLSNMRPCQQDERNY